ncbi:MAG TPA: ChuX/HutX family heme-like substrate-binding protein [Candidatus Methylacidiphilales bacterium]|nr:ChuX/HutX family heme-like substrate-binding protein [Candidatus Methylacidiphilales bacterium]
MNDTVTDLKTQWELLSKEQPNLRIRDAAAKLGVSEAQLLATDCGKTVTRLEGDFTLLLKEFPRLGRVMCLTRNDVAVHERKGEFIQLDFFHGMGQIVGPDIDLRLFMSHWVHAFAVNDTENKRTAPSFQFFDAQGVATHKVYVQPEGNLDVYAGLVKQYTSANQDSSVEVVEAEPAIADRPDSEVDVQGFREAWDATQDTHAFFSLLKKFNLGRLQALRLAERTRAYKVTTDAIRILLENAAGTATPIMVFVGNPGTIQIHTGPVQNIVRHGQWINVLDKDFNLHLRDDLVSQAWVVKKATRDGVVTSVELFDAAGTNVTLFFGKRKPGNPEDPEWRKIIASLPEAE